MTDPMMLDMLGHVGYLLLSCGMFLLARKNILGWILRGSGEFIWLLIGLEMGMSSIWLWGILFLGMEVYGYRSWKNSGF